MYGLYNCISFISQKFKGAIYPELEDVWKCDHQLRCAILRSMRTTPLPLLPPHSCSESSSRVRPTPVCGWYQWKRFVFLPWFCFREGLMSTYSRKLRNLRHSEQVTGTSSSVSAFQETSAKLRTVSENVINWMILSIWNVHISSSNTRKVYYGLTENNTLKAHSATFATALPLPAWCLER